jgi:hypothetical protein
VIGKSYSSSPFDDPDRMGGTETDIPEDAPADPLDAPAMTALHTKLLDWYDQENLRQAHNRFQMAMDEDYVDGLQWTEDDAEILVDRGQAPLVFNEVKPTLDWVTGTERRTRIDYKVQPRRKEGLQDSENKTQLLKYLSDVNKTPFHRSRAFGNAVRAGMGVLEVGLRGDPTEELLFTRYQNWRQCLYDSNSVELDMSDARYFFRWKYVDEDVANAYFPTRGEAIRGSVVNGITLGGVEDEDEIWYMGANVTSSGEDFAPVGKYRPYTGSAYANSTRDRVKIMECWYTVPVPVKKFSYGPAKGETFDAMNPEHVQYAAAGFSIYDNVEMQVWCAVFTKSGMLFNGRSPYKHNRIPFVVVWCYRRARDNAPYGMVRNLRDPQDDLNKRASKSLWILSSKQVVMDENAVEDVEELRTEVARPDGIIVKRPNKALEIKTDVQLADAHVQLMDRDILHIRNAGGVNNENLGRTSNVTSGIALQERKESGSVVTTEPFDNLRLAVQLTGELELSNIEQFYDEPKVIRIVGERGAASFVEINQVMPDGSVMNSITESQADFVVSEQDFRSNLRQAMFESMFDLVGRLAQMNPMVALNLLDLVVEMVDVPNRDKLVARIRKLSGQRDPEAEPTPEEQQAEQATAEQQALTQQIQTETLMAQLHKLQVEAAKVKAEGSKLDADTMMQHIDGMLKALEAAQLVAAVPETTPIADEIMRSAGFKDIVPEQQEPAAVEQAEPIQESPAAEMAEPMPQAGGLTQQPTEGAM